MLNTFLLFPNNSKKNLKEVRLKNIIISSIIFYPGVGKRAINLMKVHSDNIKCIQSRFKFNQYHWYFKHLR